ncbi:MAG: ADP-glyceromanno-heptose 6-epimerase [Arenicella sp.]
MIVVTGGAGFIGSNIVRRLNARGMTDIIVVDDLTDGNKCRNIQDCHFLDYIDKDDFHRMVEQSDPRLSGMQAIFHEGACSDTMEADGKFIMKNNYDYTKSLFHYCQRNSVQFIYASSASTYGGNSIFIEGPENEQALNAYAYSKLLFDQYLRRHWQNLESQVVGLRYFNVYGRGEAHKGRMASVAYHFFNQYQDNGFVKLFEGSGGYGNGEQLRDFVWVDDVVDINLHFLDNPEKSGIFNAGTGSASSFNQVAAATLNTMLSEEKSIKDWEQEGLIRYIEFPAALVGKYQSFTQADLTKLRQEGGYKKDLATVEEGVAAYIDQLQDNSIL